MGNLVRFDPDIKIGGPTSVSDGRSRHCEEELNFRRSIGTLSSKSENLPSRNASGKSIDFIRPFRAFLKSVSDTEKGEK